MTKEGLICFDRRHLSNNFRLAYLLSMKKVESTLVLAVTAFVLSFGFMFGTGNNANYALIYQFAHQYFWSALFFMYGSVKALSIWTRVDYKVNTLNSIVGLWAWLYLFLSFTVFDTTPVAPTEAMLAIPVLAEAWLMLSYQHNKITN